MPSIFPNEWFENQALIKNARHLIQSEKQRSQPDPNIIWKLSTQIDRLYAQQQAIEAKYSA